MNEVSFLAALKCFSNISVLSNRNSYYKLFKPVTYRFHVVDQSLGKSQGI